MFFHFSSSFPNVFPFPKDFDHVKHLLRYNDWQHDPLSAHGYQGPTEPNAPENAIAARYDLHPWPKAFVFSLFYTLWFVDCFLVVVFFCWKFHVFTFWFWICFLLYMLLSVGFCFVCPNVKSIYCQPDRNVPGNQKSFSFSCSFWQVRKPFGNTDAKICRAADCLQLRFSAISGPTADDQPPFEWSGEWESSPHLGHPTRFNYSWIDFEAFKRTSENEVLMV